MRTNYRDAVKRISLSWDHEEAVRIADEALKRRGRRLSSEEAKRLAARSAEKRTAGCVERRRRL